MMLVWKPPGGLTIQSLKSEEYLHNQTAIIMMMTYTTFREVVQLHEPHLTPPMKGIFIPGCRTTLHLTQMGNFQGPHPTPHKGKDCILEYQNLLLLHQNMSTMDTQGEHCHTPRKVECPTLTTWMTFGEGGFNGLIGDHCNSTCWHAL